MVGRNAAAVLSHAGAGAVLASRLLHCADASTGVIFRVLFASHLFVELTCRVCVRSHQRSRVRGHACCTAESAAACAGAWTMTLFLRTRSSRKQSWPDTITVYCCFAMCLACLRAPSIQASSNISIHWFLLLLVAACGYLCFNFLVAFYSVEF